MKAYSFYFNASDWLSSPAVKQMSLAERGAYIGLLAFAWNSEQPGTLPASADKVRRIAEMSIAEWAESGEALLEKFPLSECQTYRYNARLLAEVAKEEARSQKGRAAAAKRWQCTGNANPSKNDANPSKKARVGNAQEQEQVSTNVDEERAQASAPSPVLKSEKGGKHPAQLRAEADGADTFSFAESFFTKPAVYASVLRDIGFADIDAAHYAREIGLAAADTQDRLTMPAWRKRLTSWLKNDKAKGCLLLATAAGVRASPDPEADRLRAAQPVAVAQPTAGYTPYVSKPNLPGTVSEPPPAYGPASTVRQF